MIVFFLALALGLANQSFDDFVKAKQAYDADTKSEPKLVALVSILYQTDQTARAIGLLQPFVKAYPRASRARLFLALGYTREEKYEQGRALAAQVAAELPRDHYAQHVLALSLFGLNRFDEAETRFKRSLEIKPDFPDAHFELGQLYARKAETLEHARVSFQRAFDAGYRTAEVHKNLGSISIKLGVIQDAIEHLNAAIARDPNYADAYFLLADALRKSGSPEKAAEAMQQFQSLSVSATDKRQRETKGHSLYQEGMSLLGKDDIEKAYIAFKSAAELMPQLDTAHYRMAQIEYLRGSNPAALQSIRRAIEWNPFEPEYYFVLARCLEETNVKEATEAATKAVSLNPAIADFHNLLGNLHVKSGDFARAVESYRRATTIDPKNEAFRTNLTFAQQKLPKK